MVATLGELWTGTRWQRVLTVVALLIVYGLAFEWIGFVSSTFALCSALMLFVDPVRWPIAVVISVAAPLGIWVAGDEMAEDPIARRPARAVDRLRR